MRNLKSVLNPKTLFYIGLSICLISGVFVGHTVYTATSFENQNPHPDTPNNVSEVLQNPQQELSPDTAAQQPVMSKTTHPESNSQELGMLTVNMRIDIQTTAFRIFGDYLVFSLSYIKYILTVFGFASFLLGLAMIERSKWRKRSISLD